MNLPKAIEIKQLALDTGIVNDPEEFKVADKLSIEALKFVQQMGVCPFCKVPFTLPSETKE